MPDLKEELHRNLRASRATMLAKLDDLSEYDRRRPMTPTGTNLLGLVKHLAGCEIGYFGDTFGRPMSDPPSWCDDELLERQPQADMWATADESREHLTGWYRRAWAHADQTFDALDLDAIGHVPWWPGEHGEVTLHRILTHMTAETHRHAGQADIVREFIDGKAGLRADNSNLADLDSSGWAAYRDRLEQTARAAATA